MQTFEIPWINAGKPFSFGFDNVTPDAVKAAHSAHAHALQAAAGDLRADAHPEVVKEVLAGARTAARVAQSSALLYHSLVNVDPKLAQLGEADVVRRLTLKDYAELTKALNRADRPAGKASPLETTQPPASSASE